MPDPRIRPFQGACQGRDGQFADLHQRFRGMEVFLGIFENKGEGIDRGAILGSQHGQGLGGVAAHLVKPVPEALDQNGDRRHGSRPASTQTENCRMLVWTDTWWVYWSVHAWAQTELYR